MVFFRQMLQDIREGQNLDVYITVPVAIAITLYGIVGSNQNVIFAAIIAVLNLLSFNLLANRHRNHEIQRSIQSIAAKVPPSLTAEVYHSKGGAEDSLIYDVLTKAVERAERSILAVSIAKPSNLDPTSNREKYHVALRKNLEGKLKAKRDFTFARIFQIESVQGDTITSSQMDALTLSHCEHLIETRKRKSTINIYCRQIREGISPISFLIIDDKELILLMPSVLVDEEGKIRSYKQIGTQILFKDPEKVIIEEMRELFYRLLSQATEIAKVVR